MFSHEEHECIASQDISKPLLWAAQHMRCSTTSFVGVVIIKPRQERTMEFLIDERCRSNLFATSDSLSRGHTWQAQSARDSLVGYVPFACEAHCRVHAGRLSPFM